MTSNEFKQYIIDNNTQLGYMLRMGFHEQAMKIIDKIMFFQFTKHEHLLDDLLNE